MKLLFMNESPYTVFILLYHIYYSHSWSLWWHWPSFMKDKIIAMTKWKWESPLAWLCVSLPILIWVWLTVSQRPECLCLWTSECLLGDILCLVASFMLVFGVKIMTKTRTIVAMNIARTLYQSVIVVIRD